MASSARIFFAGIGTSFIILGAGFAGGLMLAKSALQDTPVQARASTPPLDLVRVILPTTAEAAQPPQPSAASPVQTVPPSEAKVPEKQVEKVDTRKAEAEERERKKRYAERKARRTARAKQQLEAKRQIDQAIPQPGIMAFGGDEPRPVGFFGN
jgi:hypothetical protein